MHEFAENSLPPSWNLHRIRAFYRRADDDVTQSRAVLLQCLLVRVPGIPGQFLILILRLFFFQLTSYLLEFSFSLL